MQDKQCSRASSPSVGGEETSPAAAVSVACCVCRVRMWNPLILPCLHTFCENCIIQWLDEYLEQFGDLPKKMRCPTCSQPVRIPDAGLEGLRYDAQVSHVRGMMERLNMHDHNNEELSLLERKLISDIQREQTLTTKKDGGGGGGDYDTVKSGRNKGKEADQQQHAAHLGKCHLCSASASAASVQNKNTKQTHNTQHQRTKTTTATSTVCHDMTSADSAQTHVSAGGGSGIIKAGHFKSASRRPSSSSGVSKNKHARMDYESEGGNSTNPSVTG